MESKARITPLIDLESFRIEKVVYVKTEKKYSIRLLHTVGGSRLNLSPMKETADYKQLNGITPVGMPISVIVSIVNSELRQSQDTDKSCLIAGQIELRPIDQTRKVQLFESETDLENSENLISDAATEIIEDISEDDEKEKQIQDLINQETLENTTDPMVPDYSSALQGAQPLKDYRY